jgi:hypothetical protein
MTIVSVSRPTRLAARSYRKLAERTAVLYGRELDRLNRRAESLTKSS